jgi:uncharacterized protein
VVVKFKKYQIMKQLTLLFAAIIYALAASAQTVNPNYDAVLAKKLGAPDNGMKFYVLVMLKTGSNNSTDKNFVDSCFAGHMANIQRLAGEKKLIVAGPMGKNDKSYRGIFILDVPFEEAPAILQTDPAIHGGLLDYEAFKWYGSAALPVYMEADDKVWKVRQ